ncbi:MAG TPA: septum formation family protein [Actinophytocola sp.]|uniref:septum formation family protein n=1 Tax=Actinophytocola sp. TaxID=1872138 RepID=UPI002DDCC705|nr:septum formation family protein [Actinophytocola sp.]HEV2781833.1 septum formation family protein [Actinophytocola sp.]
MSATETTRTRLVMAGAFVGALVLLALSVLFSWPVTVTGASPSAADEAAAAFDSPPGTCLDWPADNPRAMRRLDCAQPHLFEVTSIVDISPDYGQSAPPPEEKQWQTIAEDKCTPGVTSYLGGKLDPFGKYGVSALKPTEEQWRSGDRKLRCGVHRVTPRGTRVATKGSAANADQSDISEPGTCFALADKDIGDPIDCGSQHAVEIVGNVDLSVAFTAGFPPPDDQKVKLSELCAVAAAEYSGGVNLAEKKLTVFWDPPLREESWAAGSRKVDCKVGSLLPDGSGLAPVAGSVRAAPAPTAPPPSTPGG